MKSISSQSYMLVRRHLPRLIEVAKQSSDPRVREARRLLSNMLETWERMEVKENKNQLKLL